MTIAERFWAKVERRGPAECWPWTGARDYKGYGRFGKDGRNDHAHRVALELILDIELRPDQFACHTCDYKSCCNPAHLYVGTALDNSRDAAARNPRYGWQPRRGEQHHMARLTVANVLFIREQLAKGRMRQGELAALFGVTRTHICSIYKRRSWSHV